MSYTPPTVEELLDQVDYSYDPEYVPSNFALSFVNFIKLITDGKGEASPTPVMHYRMLDALPHPTHHTKYQRVANLASRGTAKTSIFAEILFFYIAVFGKIDGFGEVSGIIYISDTVENGVKNLKESMEERYYNSKFLQEYLPDVKFNQLEIILKNVDGHKLGIRMFGAASGFRGVKIWAKRPQLGVLDDVLSDKNAKSHGIIGAIKDALYKGMNHALDPTKRKIIFSGTPFNEGDPLYSAIMSGAWYSNVYPICEKFPCTREEFRGAWGERFSYDFLMSEYESMKLLGELGSFYQELMLRINNGDDTLVDASDIDWYTRSEVLKNRTRYNVYITTDFATSELKSADFSAISVWFLNSSGHWFWVDGILERQTMDKNIDDLFRLVQKYSPRSVGVEINGQQGGFIPWIRQQMVSRDAHFTLAKTIGTKGKPTRLGIMSPTKTSKLERFNVMLPDIRDGKLHLPSEIKDKEIMKEAYKQLMGVSKNGLSSKHDDWLDTFAQLGLMDTYPPFQAVDKFVDPEDSTYNMFFHPEEEEETSLHNYMV